MFIANTNQSEGLCEMLKRLIPSSLAAWKILPSTSILTALVHSSNKANCGLKISHVSIKNYGNREVLQLLQVVITRLFSIGFYVSSFNL